MKFSIDKTLDNFCSLFGYQVSPTTSYLDKVLNLSYLQQKYVKINKKLPQQIIKTST